MVLSSCSVLPPLDLDISKLVLYKHVVYKHDLYDMVFFSSLGD